MKQFRLCCVDCVCWLKWIFVPLCVCACVDALYKLQQENPAQQHFFVSGAERPVSSAVSPNKKRKKEKTVSPARKRKHTSPDRASPARAHKSPVSSPKKARLEKQQAESVEGTGAFRTFSECAFGKIGFRERHPGHK